MQDIREELLSLADEPYKEFTAKLIPTVEKNKIIGIRTPKLRAFAKNISEQQAQEFLKDLPHTFYEENNLHSFLIERVSDFDECVFQLNRFLPYVDNWATCDCMRPKVLKNYPDRLLKQIDSWLESEHTYTVRFAILMLMTYFLDDNFKEQLLNKVLSVKSEQYYINMMIAWYFATALAKQYSSAVRVLEQNQLPAWVHNKTIQKAVESYRITDEQKAYLKTLKRKI